MLFENDYFQYKFPRPQYLGAKYSLLPWISQYIPTGVNTVLDAFGGSQSVAYYFKQMGFKVYTNDFLSSCSQIGTSLIENKSVTLSETDVEMLFAENKSRKNLIQTNFTDIFFVEQETILLDNFRCNCERLGSLEKKALALAIMNRAMQRKVIMGHFAHTQALVYANNPDRVKRNKSISLPLKDLFLEQLPLYNQAVFDNKQDNKSYNQDILELLPVLRDVNLAYFDPPYTDSHSDYQSFYHLLETFTEYWQDKAFINKTHSYFPKRNSGFDKKAEVVESLHQLFKLSKDIPHWLISWNDRSFPSVEDFTKIISQYKKVQVVKKPYLSSKGGRGSVKGSHEVLFVCSPKQSNPNIKLTNKLYEQDIFRMERTF
jgi:adenine-specific DNA-methyltransferase